MTLSKSKPMTFYLMYFPTILLIVMLHLFIKTESRNLGMVADSPLIRPDFLGGDFGGVPSDSGNYHDLLPPGESPQIAPKNSGLGIIVIFPDKYRDEMLPSYLGIIS